MNPLQYATLSLNRALWGEITPELRAVSIRADSRSVSGRFVFDVEPTEELREIVEDAETEVIADYGCLHVGIPST